MPQQAAPQPQPQQRPPQPQQQQQPPQAKQPPIMGLPSMQGPKKMAGGGIIAFNGEKDSEVPKAEEATSSIGDFFRRLVEPPEFLKGRIERAKDIGYAESQVPYPWEAVTPSERTRRKQETERVLAGGKRPPETSVPEAVKDDAKKPDENLKIQNVPDPTSGIAALMQSMGGGRGGGGGGGDGLSSAAKRLAEFSEKETPEQQAYKASALKRAEEFANFKSSQLSGPERDAYVKKEFEQNQAYSKPHFDMMQKLIDEEKAANNAGKESEVYKMLGKMGGALMSSRGAFGPALGRAVGEGIDYSDKVDAARAAAERMRRQAQMELLKARMSDEKGDRQSALASLADRERYLQAADKLDLDAKKASTEILKGVADSDTKRQIEGARLGNALEIAGIKNQHALERSGFARDLALAKYGAQLDAARLKGLPSIAEYYKMQEQADSLFANPFQGKAAAYLSKIGPDGANAIRKAEMMGMKPQEALKDAAIASAVEKAKAAYINDVLRNTNRVNASSPSTTSWEAAMARTGG
jgi:hypothetical protein